MPPLGKKQNIFWYMNNSSLTCMADVWSSLLKILTLMKLSQFYLNFLYKNNSKNFVWKKTCFKNHENRSCIDLLLDFHKIKKQPCRDVLRKRCFENIQDIYRRTPMSKYNFNKIKKQLHWNHTSAWMLFCNFFVHLQNTFL